MLRLPQPASITTDAYDVNTDIEPRLEVFSEAGFRFIHWCDHWVSAHLYSSAEIERTRELLDRYGLTCTDIHGVCDVEEGEPFSLDRWVELNVNRMEFIRALGGDALVVHLPLPGLVAEAAPFDAATQMVDALLPEARRREVALTVENGDAELIDRLFSRYAPSELGFCFDSGHSHIAGDMDALEAFASRLLVVHLHDNHGENDEHDLPGTGTVDWVRVRRFLSRAPHLQTLNLEVGQRTEEDHLLWAQRAYGQWERFVAGAEPAV